MANFDMTQAKVAVDLSNPDFVRFVDPDIGSRHRFEKSVEAGHQPFGGDRGRGGDPHLHRVIGLADALEGVGEAVNGI